ncbi:MAG: ComF family protein [Acidobacteriota bacterium]|nr:MAG: ComF family protein [Acidobacteriota bacterium]
MRAAVVDSLVHLLFAVECKVCGAATALRSETICYACREAAPEILSSVCAACGRPFLGEGSARSNLLVQASRNCGQCLRKRPPFEAARSFGLYRDGLRTMVHGFKYGADLSAGRVLTRFLRKAAERHGILENVDAVTYVPSHWTRRLARGFEPVRVLAMELARDAGLPAARLLRKRFLRKRLSLMARLLLKTLLRKKLSLVARLSLAAKLLRNTRITNQVGLSLPERKSNVRRAFAPTRRMRGNRPRSVLLVDDVYTTGATARACARALRRGGARRIRILTVARTWNIESEEHDGKNQPGREAVSSVGL